MDEEKYSTTRVRQKGNRIVCLQELKQNGIERGLILIEEEKSSTRCTLKINRHSGLQPNRLGQKILFSF